MKLPLLRTWLLLVAALAPLSLPAAEGRVFGGGLPVPLAQIPTSLVMADLDGNGRPDAAVVHGGADLMSVLLDDPQSTLGSAVSHPTGVSPVFIAAGDLDRSGFPDLLVLNAGSS